MTPQRASELLPPAVGVAPLAGRHGLQALAGAPHERRFVVEEVGRPLARAQDGEGLRSSEPEYHSL